MQYNESKLMIYLNKILIISDNNMDTTPFGNKALIGNVNLQTKISINLRQFTPDILASRQAHSFRAMN